MTPAGKRICGILVRREAFFSYQKVFTFVSIRNMKLLETIRYERGKCRLLDLHEERMLRSLTALAPNSPMLKQVQEKGLEALLRPYLYDWGKEENSSSKGSQAVYKLRLIYDALGIQKVELIPYKALVIQELWLCEVPANFDYEYKFLDRTCLNPFALQEGKQAKIPLFVKEDLLTDTSFTNVILRFGEELLTPTKPLLRGVMREHLLGEGRIREQELRVEDLEHCDEILLINAMLPLERAISIKQIFPRLRRR